MALVKERHNPNDSQMFTFFDNIIGTTDFEEGDSSEKSGGGGGGGGSGGFTKNFGISRSSSTISSPNSMNSGGLAHRTSAGSNNYHQHEAEGHSRSVMTFKPEFDTFMQPAANGSSSCFLRFDEEINDEQAYSGLDHPSHELNSGSSVRLLESFNSIHTSTSGTQENHHGEMDLFGWANSNPQQQIPDHDHTINNGDHVATQESAFHKRPHSGESMQANKKQCTNSTKKGKPKSTSQPQSSTKDPQSIAAKNRRERISERLKVLQDLVPNGSKVDLVTMLEKAISYVKFLQLQVKVLATDEFWPVQGGKAPELSQVKEAIDAILSASQRERNNSTSTVK